MITKRARRIAEYLEKECGWTVFDDSCKCIVCGAIGFGDKFCRACGGKMKKDKQNAALHELESAIAFALEEADQ